MSVNSIRQDEIQQEVSKKQTLKRLYRYLFAYKKQLLLVTLLLALTVSISLISPLFIERAIDVHVANGDWKRLLMLGTVVLAAYLAFMLGTRVQTILMARVTNQVLLTIREELYAHIQTLSFHFFDSRPTGKILAYSVGTGICHRGGSGRDHGGKKCPPGAVRPDYPALPGSRIVCDHDDFPQEMAAVPKEIFQSERLCP